MRFGRWVGNYLLTVLAKIGNYLLAVGFLWFISPIIVLAQEVPSDCGPPATPSQDGPFDYRADHFVATTTAGTHKLWLGMVERNHFTPEVEALVRGKSTYIGGDIAFTLRAFPNHHRALIAMVALGVKEKTDKPQGSTYSIECWFRRAVAWRPDDNIVRMLYANYLVNAMRIGDAERQLVVAENQARENPFTHHNIGLIYFDMKNYDKALIHAHKAYALGLGVQTLKQRLIDVGRWPAATDVPTIEPAKPPP